MRAVPCLLLAAGLAAAHAITSGWRERLSPVYTPIVFHMYEVHMSGGVALSALHHNPHPAAMTAHQKIYHDAAHPSRLVLPVIPAGSRPCAR